MGKDQLIGATDSRVRRAVDAALSTQPDIVVERRPARGAGRRDWYLLRAPEDYDGLVRDSGPADLFLIALLPQLQLRGEADEVFTDRVSLLLEGVRDWSDECVVGILRGDSAQLEAEAFSVDEKDDVREWASASRGEMAVAGLWPDGFPEGQSLTSVMPQPDGSLRLAPY